MGQFTMQSKDLYLRVEDNILLRFQHFLPKNKLNNKPNILILEGRGTFIEKSSHTIKRLQNDGYEVWVFDWRGQGLSTRIVGRRGYVDNYNSYLRDLDCFIKTFLKNSNNNAPLVVLGQSMGAHICLRYINENPGMIDGAILTAPMLEINTGIYSKKIASLLSKTMCLLGASKQFVFGQGEYNQITEAFEGNVLTRNREMFYKHKQLCIDRPELVVGGVTYGWVDATMRSSKKLLNAHSLHAIDIPINVYAAENDRVVKNDMLYYIERHIKNILVEVIPNARHVLLCETEDVQNLIHNGINDFISSNFPKKIQKQYTLDSLCNTDGIFMPYTS